MKYDFVVISFIILAMFAYGFLFYHLINFMIVTGWAIPCI